MTEDSTPDPLPPIGAGGLVDLRVLGAPVSLRTRTEGQAERIRALWARCLDPAPPRKRPGRLVIDSTLPLTRELDQRLTFNLTEAGIEHRAGRSLLLHAAGLAQPDGRVLALVAESGTGKTTAAAVLCRSDFGYVTDETVSIDRDGSITPFAKPLAVVQGPDPRDKALVSPDHLGLLRPQTDDLRAAGLVLLHRDPEHEGDPAIERLPLIDSVLALVPHTSALTRLDRPLATLASLVAGQAPVYRLTYRDIGDCATMLTSLLSDEKPPPPAWSLAPLPTAAPPGTSAEVAAAPLNDAVRLGDEVLVMVGAVPVRLSPLGTTIWETARGGASGSEILEASVSAHGAHPEAAGLVRAHVQELCRNGVLRLLDPGAAGGSAPGLLPPA